MKLITIFLFLILTAGWTVKAQVHDKSWQDITQKKEGSWFATQEAKDIAENVLLYQRSIGGWVKNTPMQLPLSNTQKTKLSKLKTSTEDLTIDNGATTQEMLFLSKMYRQNPDERYKNAFLLGLDYLIKSQYNNGGWPQFYPLKKGYYSHITYNDDAMVNILNLLKSLLENNNVYSIKPSQETLSKIKNAFDKGIDCILKTQYRQNGILTSWCAQHDEITLEPAKARAYELPSLSGKESAQIVLLLMSIENPSQKIISAVQSAVAWFEKVKITGIDVTLTRENGKIVNKEIMIDENAPALWARFMELDSNTPFFCDRDGIKKYALNDIGPERRNGYAWHTREPQEVLDSYSEWTSRYVTQNISKPKNEYHVVVAKDGTGDYSGIQEAVNNSKAFPYERIIISIKNGVYNEKIQVYSWNTKVSFIGESKENTIITFDDNFKKLNVGRNSTFHTSTLLVEGNDFIAKNLTIQNTSGDVGQAVALSVNANRCFFENCSFLGFQDTVYTTGEGFKQYFKNCYIEGSTDFIFGEATVLFEACEIHSKSNSYITAASTPKNQSYGYVFKNCILTADDNINEVYLGRPWRMYAKTVFMDCFMDHHIKPEGWHNWSNKEAETTTFYAEYHCKGQGYKPENRVKWSHQLTKDEAEKFTIDHILADYPENSEIKWYLNL